MDKEKVNKKIENICRLVLRINLYTKYNCFLGISPHVDMLDIRIYEREKYFETKNYYAYAYYDKGIDELKNIEKRLKSILKKEIERIENVK